MNTYGVATSANAYVLGRCTCYLSGDQIVVGKECAEHVALLSFDEPFYSVTCVSCGSRKRGMHTRACRFMATAMRHPAVEAETEVSPIERTVPPCRE